MSDDIALMPASVLVEHYRAKRLSPVEATRAALARIASHDERVNAFRLVDEDAALAAARDSEARWLKDEPSGLLDGVPASIKDLVLTKGWSTLKGSRTVDPDQPWDEDAPAVARLREHGAVLLGKTTTPEFGWKGVTDSALTGITRNPWNTTCTPGGSSGGAAVAVALGMGALAIGTDGGGSIRIPAGFTGVFGLKPSFGRVPVYPMSPFATLSHLGPMTRTVADAALMLTVMAAPDARDWHALPYEKRDYRAGLEDGVKGLKVAFSADLGYADVDPEVAGLVAVAARTFAELGATVFGIDPGFENPEETFKTHWYAGAAQMLRTLGEAERDLIDPGLSEIARHGAAIPLADYLDAVTARGGLGRHMRRFHEAYDLLLTPTLPIPAFAAGVETPDPSRPDRWADWTPFTYPFNLTQQPAASITCGFTGAGLPVGLQVVGPMHADSLVLRACRAYEARNPFTPPPSRPSEP